MEKIIWTGVFLAGIGFFPQHSGFAYLASSIAAVATNPAEYYTGEKTITGLIHEQFGISEAAARRCMDYAIRAAWNSVGSSALHSIFPGDNDYPPTVYEFIYRSAVELNGVMGGVRPCAECSMGSDRSCILKKAADLRPDETKPGVTRPKRG